MPPDYANIVQSGEAVGKGLDGNRKDRGQSGRM
jgi:hypothetical protein